MATETAENEQIKCKCGSTQFIVTEQLVWSATMDDEGILQCFHKTSGIDDVFCSKCDEPIPEFEDNHDNINFN